MARTFAFALIAAVLLAPSAALAETSAPLDAPPPCTHAWPVIPDRFPANTPGIPFRGTPIAPSLLAPDGTPIPTTLEAPEPDGEIVLALSAPLAPGKGYRVQWTDECGGPSTQAFEATGVRALPTSAGTLSASTRPEGLPCDESGLPTGLAYSDVYLAYTPEIAAFRELVAVDLIVDGSPVDVSEGRYGDLGYDGFVGGLARKCPYGDGVFHVAARVRMPNGPTYVTDTITIGVPCPTPCSGATTTPPSSNGDDAGTSATPAGVSSGGPGCSTSAGAVSGAYALTGALAIASCAALLRRRRARRPTRR